MARRKEDHFGPHDVYLGIDVGKSFHWAFALGAGGEVLIDRPLPNRQADVDALVAEAGAGALVVHEGVRRQSPRSHQSFPHTTRSTTPA